MAELTPTANHLIVEIVSQNEQEDKELQNRLEKAGMVIANTNTNDPARASGPPQLGQVYKIGPGMPRWFRDSIIVGDRVVFHEPQPHGFKWEGKKLLALKPDQVWARLERDS